LALAEQLEWDLMTCWEDDRERYFHQSKGPGSI